MVHQERAGLLFMAGEPTEVQAQRMSALPSHWAHEIATVERGCLLVARKPDMGPLFTQAIVLLLEHGVCSLESFPVLSPVLCDMRRSQQTS
jgi:hypothetical protein